MIINKLRLRYQHLIVDYQQIKEAALLRQPLFNFAEVTKQLKNIHHMDRFLGLQHQDKPVLL